MSEFREKILLVNLTISQWSGKKLDKKVTQKIETDYNAHNSGKFNKNLIAETSLEKIKKVAGEMRTTHYENTLSWSDNGDRILPTENYMRYMEKLRALRKNYDEAVSEFVQSYPDYIKQAQHDLNGMFNPDEYPDESVIENKFGVSIEFNPLPDTSDIRVNVSDKERERIRVSVESKLETRQREAVKELFVRVKEVVGKMVERLSNSEHKFKDSLVTNISDLVELLPRMNFTNNQELTDLINATRELVVQPDILRNNDAIRQAKYNKAKELLDKVSMYA